MPIEHFPEAYRPGLRRARDWLATDKGLLLILAVIFVCRAASFIAEPPSVLQHVLEIRAPWISPALWSAGAVLLVVALRRDCPRLETVALCYATAVMALWGVLYLWTEPVLIPGPWAVADWLRGVLEWLISFLARGSLYLGLALSLIHI